MRRSSRSNVAGIHAAATTGTDCTRSAITCTRSRRLGRRAHSLLRSRERFRAHGRQAASNVGASVVNGSSSFEHHQTRASPSHSARISKLFSLLQARHPALFQVVPLASLYGGEYRLNRPLKATPAAAAQARAWSSDPTPRKPHPDLRLDHPPRHLRRWCNGPRPLRRFGDFAARSGIGPQAAPPGGSIRRDPPWHYHMEQMKRLRTFRARLIAAPPFSSRRVSAGSDTRGIVIPHVVGSFG